MSLHLPKNGNFSLNIWQESDVLKCPRSWSLIQIIHPIWSHIWSEALCFPILLGSKSLSFSIILGQSFSHRCTLIDQLVLPRSCRITRSCPQKALLSSSGPDFIEKDSRSALMANCSHQPQARLQTIGLWWPRARGLTASLRAEFSRRPAYSAVPKSQVKYISPIIG